MAFSPALDRIPPQALDAEQAVLGCMLIDTSRASIEIVRDILSPADFYRDAHRRVFEAIVHLDDSDEPVDILTVANELERVGALDQAGGRAYLMACVDVVPAVSRAASYAQRVQNAAILRRLIDAGGQIIGMAYEQEHPVNEIVDDAERLIFAVGQRRRQEYFHGLKELLFHVWEEAERAHETKRRVTGLETGFTQLDDMTSGLQPSDFIIIAGRPSMGKCLTARTLIDDPDTGERLTIEECVRRKSPRVFGIDSAGRVTPKAVSAWIDSGVQPCYRVTTRLGRSVEVTGHHPFLTARGWVPLNELAIGDRIGVPRAVPAFGSDVEGWSSERVRLLAYFIAEGGLTGTTPSFTNTDPELIRDFRAIVARGYPVCAVRQERITYKTPHARGRGQGPNPITEWLRALGLWGKSALEKRFPPAVWRWPRAFLAEFLRTLFSCDATLYAIGGYPRIEFTVASEQLAVDARDALIRFGIVAKLWRKTPRSWRVQITDPTSVATYQREIGWVGEKASRFQRNRPFRRSNTGHVPTSTWSLVRAAARSRGLCISEVARRAGEVPSGARGFNLHTRRSIPQRRLERYAEVLQDSHLARISSPDLYWDEIAAIEPIGHHQVYDLTVPEGANFIAQGVCVHNTAFALNVGVEAAAHSQKPVAVFSLEMSRTQLVYRLVCAEAKVDSSRLRSGYLRTAREDDEEDDWIRLGRAIARLGELPIYIDDSAETTALEMRAKCRRLQAEQGLGLIIVDYLQLIRGHGRSENRNQEISLIARSLKGLARELSVPVIALSQLSRTVERRDDKRPMLSDLRESGSIEAEADLVMMLYRDQYYRHGQPGEQAAPQDEALTDIAELIVAKHRNGPTGIVRLAFLRRYACFENLAEEYASEASPE